MTNRFNNEHSNISVGNDSFRQRLSLDIMIVIVLENATEKIRGMISRWIIEVKPGVFVGTINTMVREKLWNMIEEEGFKGALMIYSCNNEQGYHIDMLGIPHRSVVDLDGLQLIKIQQ